MAFLETFTCVTCHKEITVELNNDEDPREECDSCKGVSPTIHTDTTLFDPQQPPVDRSGDIEHLY